MTLNLPVEVVLAPLAIRHGIGTAFLDPHPDGERADAKRQGTRDDQNFIHSSLPMRTPTTALTAAGALPQPTLHERRIMATRPYRHRVNEVRP